MPKIDNKPMEGEILPTTRLVQLALEIIRSDLVKGSLRLLDCFSTIKYKRIFHNVYNTNIQETQEQPLKSSW